MKTRLTKQATLIAAILCITALTALAITTDIDGKLLIFALSIIAGIAGFNINKLIKP